MGSKEVPFVLSTKYDSGRSLSPVEAAVLPVMFTRPSVAETIVFTASHVPSSRPPHSQATIDKMKKSHEGRWGNPVEKTRLLGLVQSEVAKRNRRKGIIESWKPGGKQRKKDEERRKKEAEKLRTNFSMEDLRGGMTLNEIAKKCGKTSSTIGKLLELLDLQRDPKLRKRVTKAHTRPQNQILVEKARINGWLKGLRERELRIIEMRYPENGDPLSLKEIAGRYLKKNGESMSKAAIWEAEQKVIKRLRRRGSRNKK